MVTRPEHVTVWFAPRSVVDFSDNRLKRFLLVIAKKQVDRAKVETKSSPLGHHSDGTRWPNLCAFGNQVSHGVVETVV